MRAYVTAAVVPVQQQSGRRLVHAHAQASARTPHTDAPPPIADCRVASSRTSQSVADAVAYNRRRTLCRSVLVVVVVVAAPLLFLFFIFLNLRHNTSII